MKLNRKGYLTVEVILASVAAIGIAFFLMEITIKLVNITDDAYVDTDLLTDKALIIENIKASIESDIKEKEKIKSLTCNTSLECQITFNKSNTTKNITLSNNTITYGDYQKKINSSVYNLKLTFATENYYYLIKITGDNKFSKDPFEANIIVYNG